MIREVRAIYGVATDIFDDDIKTHVKGAKVINVKRLSITTNGVKTALTQPQPKPEP